MTSELSPHFPPLLSRLLAPPVTPATGEAPPITTETVETMTSTPPRVMGAEVLASVLKNSKLQLNSDESIALLTHCIALGKQQVCKAQGKDLVVFIGNTGAGKSTLVNYLCGCTMQRVPPKTVEAQGLNKVVVVTSVAQGGALDEVMKIGHNAFSMTFIPQIESQGGVTFCDCPGFLDNRGTSINIANAVNIKSAFNLAASVKIVILINYHSLNADRGRGVKDMLKICCNLFGSRENLIKYKDSILLGITHVPFAEVDEEGQREVLPLDSLKRALIEAANDDFDRGALRCLAEQLFIYDPVDSPNLRFQGALKKTDLLQALTHLAPLQSPTSIFKTVLTPEDLQGLEGIAREINTTIETLLSKKEVHSEDFKKVADYQNSLKELEVIAHPAVTRLAANVKNVISEYFSKLTHQFELTCRESEEALSAQSNVLLKAIKEGVQFFDTEVQAKVNVQLLEEQYVKLLQKQSAHKELLKLADKERDFRDSCARTDFSKAETLLQEIQRGLEEFASQHAQTDEKPTVRFEELQKLYTEAKTKHDKIYSEREDYNKKMLEAQQKLSEEMRLVAIKQQDQQKAQESVAALNQMREKFLNKCTKGKISEAKKVLIELKTAVDEYNKTHSQSGISPLIDLNVLKEHYKSSKQQKARTEKLQKDQKKSEETLKQIQDQQRQMEAERLKAEKKAKKEKKKAKKRSVLNAVVPGAGLIRF